MTEMTFELLSPECRIASLTVSAVDLPGSEGDMAVMPGHTDIMTALRPGIVRTRSNDRQDAYLVIGGFAEVTASNTIVLAQLALELGAARQGDIAAALAAASEEAESAQGSRKDAASKRLAELRELSQSLPA